MKLRAVLAAIASTVMLASSAQAGLLYSGRSAEMATDSSYTLSFSSPAVTKTSLSFIVDGYLSLDGYNGYEDDFGLKLNGNTIFAGTFNLGGGSSTTQTVVYANPYGASTSNPTNNGTDVGWAGGKEIVSFGPVLPLEAGLNTLVFSYASLAGSNHAGFQGLADEGWGVEQVELGPVPEPATWAMLGLGFAGLAGAGLGRARRDRLAAALA